MKTKSQPVADYKLGRLGRLCRDVNHLPAREAVRLVVQKASKSWRVRRAERTAKRDIAGIESSLHRLLSSGGSLANFVEGRAAANPGLPIQPGEAQQTAGLIRREFTEWVRRCVSSADLVCDNRISVLGHAIQVEEPPAWHKDYLSGAGWPAAPSGSIRGARMSPGSDIKFVWELSRFHHGLILARAFALTGDERFARKFVSWFLDWRKQNEPYTGPNWACAMEVAIRAVNLLWASSLLGGSQVFDRHVRSEMAKALLQHGIIIFSNLEYEERRVGRALQPVNGNHYLSDLAGLIYIGCAFPDCAMALAWRDFALPEFYREILRQVDEDGVHWEYSPGYHRLVLEIILSCLILVERQGIAIPEDVRNLTLKMVEFMQHYRKPSGGVPLVRDIDNGRFCILGSEDLTSHDHVLALGAIYFNRPDLHQGGAMLEDCLWHFGSKAVEWHRRATGASTRSSQSTAALSSVPVQLPEGQLESRLFRHSGFAIMRHRSHQLLAVCCPQGVKGFCGHTHNDFLSFELEAFGRTFLTDCGSYVYSQSPEWRNRFRSTASHNTVVIDGQEQNFFDESDLFEIDSRVRPKVTLWTTERERDILEAEYTLTLPDASTVTHQRRFVFLKEQTVWLLRDRILGTGQHTIETRFHFDAGLKIIADGDGQYRTTCTPGPNLFLKSADPFASEANLEAGWVSRTYATKHPIMVLRFSAVAELPFEQQYVLAATPDDATQAEFPAADWGDRWRGYLGQGARVVRSNDVALELQQPGTILAASNRPEPRVALAGAVGFLGSAVCETDKPAATPEAEDLGTEKS